MENKQQRILDDNLEQLFFEIAKRSNLKDTPKTADAIRDKIKNDAEYLQKLEAIETLNLDYLPKEIGLFKGLQSLSLFHNLLSTLPAGFINLQKLETLSISCNRLLSKLKGD